MLAGAGTSQGVPLKTPRFLSRFGCDSFEQNDNMYADYGFMLAGAGASQGVPLTTFFFSRFFRCKSLEQNDNMFTD